MMCKKIIARVLLCSVIPVLFLAGCGSLTRSATRGDLDGVKKYLAKGADINEYDRWGWTPLMWAIYYNYYDVVKYMLENQANPNVRTHKDYGSIAKDSTPLIVAAYYGYGGLARLLLQHGADPQSMNSRDETAHSLAEKYEFTEVLDILEGKGGARYSRENKEKEDRDRDDATQTILMNDGSRIVGRIVSQTRTHVTVRTKYNTMSIEKNKISEIKFK